MFTIQMQNNHVDYSQKFKAFEKDMDDFIASVQGETKNLKSTLIQSLNKKADFSMLDRLNDMVSKKVDNEHMR